VNRIRTLKAIDASVGRVAVPLARCIPLSPSKPEHPTSVLVIRPGGIGDAVLLIPTLVALMKTYPHAHVTILAERRNAAIFALCPGIENVFRYNVFSEFRSAVFARYDLVIDTEQWHRLSAVIARLCRPKTLIGFAANERERLFSHAIYYSHDDYEAASFLRLLEPLRINASEPEMPFLRPPQNAVVNACERLKPLADNPFVVIFPGASIPERRWGAKRFHALAERARAVGYAVVVVGGKEDKAQGDEIVSGGMGLNLAGVTSLIETAAVLQKSQLLISGDSGVLHLAVGLGVSTVSLFGPGRAMKWAPKGDNHTVINKNLPCSPCTIFGTTPPCPINARCMTEIGIDEVADKMIAHLIP